MKKRRSFFDDDFFGFEEFDEMEEMIKDMVKNHFKDFTPASLRAGKPAVFGFSMRVSENGKPQIQEFGNIEHGRVKTEREPLIDVLNGEKEITVIAELPGVDKQYLNLSILNNFLTINVLDPERKFAKKLPLPSDVFEQGVKATLKNGILEVILKKKEPDKKTTEIKIE